MGCAQSKIDNEEAVSRCKDRRNFMKDAVGARNAFASAHSFYAVALKNTGAALSDYAQGEAPPPQLAVGGGGGGANDIASEPPPPPPPPMPEANLPPPPPPPPLPNFSPATPLQRAMTMPAALSQPGRKMKEIDGIEEEQEEEQEGGDSVGGFRRNECRRKELKGAGNEADETPMKAQAPPPPPPPPENQGMAWDYFFNADQIPGETLDELEEDEEDDEEEEEDFMEEHNGKHNNNFGDVHGNVGGLDDGAEFKTPEKLVMRGTESIIEEMTPITPEKQFMHSNTAPPVIRGGVVGGKVGGGSGNSVDLLKVLTDIDDHFLKASESAQEVSKMLEATRLHYHSNFADNRGHIDHAASVMRAITWNKSFKGVPNGEGGKNEYDAEDYETHATVLEKLLAWEKKLYEEVKTGELMKLEYQRKVSVLNRLKKKSSSIESLEKAKAAVSHLHTRYIVDMQSLDSTVAEVNDIRDKQLYPKLVALADGMGKMWESMWVHHKNQLNIVTELRSLDVSGCPKETSEYHHERTSQLLRVVEDWRLQFEKLVANQKHYINALNSWLKLNLIPIESSLKEKISSPPRAQHPPIQQLLHLWHDCLEKLPDEHTKSAITSFSAVIKTILEYQEEEIKLKEKCEETRKEFRSKSQSFDDWYKKYLRRRTPPDQGDTDRVTDSSTKDPITEKQFVVESVEKRLKEEEEAHCKHCLQVREKSIGNLKIRLPELFRAMSDYSQACFEAYNGLLALTRSQVPNGARPT